MDTETCLVLMFKSPQRSKRRLAAEIGAHAQTAAQHLFACAAEDLADWPGPTCYAPATSSDLIYARRQFDVVDLIVQQGQGNLGERIVHVNKLLIADGYTRQLFIGMDCPALDTDYLRQADAALNEADVVFGPAYDGGVVLMGVSGRWPALEHLPWSTGALGQALIDCCARANLSVQLLAAHSDIDCAEDLRRLPVSLQRDQRPGRRQLCNWIESETFA